MSKLNSGIPKASLDFGSRLNIKRNAAAKDLEVESIWGKSHSAVQDTGSSDAVISRFVELSPEESITSTQKIVVNSSLIGVAESVAEVLKQMGYETRLKADEEQYIGIECANFGGLVIVRGDRSNSYDDYALDEVDATGVDATRRHIRGYKITFCGTRAFILEGSQRVSKVYEDKHHASIKWWFDNGGRAANKVTYLDKTSTNLLPEFYPYLEISGKAVTPQAYIEKFLVAESSILMLAGPPGTGKTTLLRHLIVDNNLGASVVYDEALMVKDHVFQSFMFDDSGQVLVIEDADTILSSRELHNNKLMSRFLNIADGLIKLPNKKLIFTTNLTDFTRVDEALLRPGRCFGVVHTRALNFTEAQAAAKVAGLNVPTARKDYTLAELFNPAQGGGEVRRVGFLGVV